MVADRPATFREVFSSSEYRAVYPASALSWIGDYLAKAAVTALVYNQTQSVVASAAAFAISYLPWVVGGPVLAAMAERYPQRSTMVVADLCRMALIGLVALPHLPIPAMLGLLFLTALLNPPFDAARSALLPRILEGDRYVLGLSLQNSTNQGAQLVGYMVGAAIAAGHPRAALLADAATFLFSATMVWFGVRPHPGAVRAARRHLLRETAEGFQVVFGTPALRSIAVLVLTVSLFTIVPEGLAAAWAGTLEPDPGRRGFAQGIIMVANPLGYMIAGVLIGRLMRPHLRQRLIRPFAILAPAVLIPSLLKPDAIVVAVMAGLCGVCVAAMLPASNGLFVQVLPKGFRARSFGVMQGGLQILQGLGVLVTGLLAAKFALAVVVGCWCLLGTLAVAAISGVWPSPAEFTDAISRARAANALPDGQAQDGRPVGQRSPAGGEPQPTTQRAGESAPRPAESV